MTIIDRIKAIYAAATSNLKDPGVWMHTALGGGVTASGQVVNEETALTVAAVMGCVNTLAKDIGQIPFELMKRTKDGDAVPAVDHPLYPLLLNSPNGVQTAQELKELDMRALLLRGTAYRQIVRKGGVIQEINYLNPDRIEVKTDFEGNIVYIYTRHNGEQVTLQQDEVWRTMGLSYDGIIGLSPIAYMRESIGFALAAEEQGASIYRNGMQVTTVIQHPSTMTETAYKNLKKSMDERTGAKNAGKSFILEEGAKIEKLSMSAIDAQFLETRRFQVEEIARAIGVPAYKINLYDGMTFNNVAQLSQDYVTSSVLPWAHKFEQTGARDLLLPNERKKYFLRADPTILLRGDPANRAAYYASGIQNGWMTRNEARTREGLNKIDGLDEPLSPLNMGKGSQLQGTNDGKDN